MLARHAAILLALGSGLSARLVAQKRSQLVLSPACFDSLPQDVAHPCDAFIVWKSKASLGALYTKVNTFLTADSLTLASHDSSDTGVVIIVAPQIPHGNCAKLARGPDSLAPAIAVHFDAAPHSKKENRYQILVRGSALALEDHPHDGMALALCYLERYDDALEGLR